MILSKKDNRKLYLEALISFFSGNVVVAIVFFLNGLPVTDSFWFSVIILILGFIPWMLLAPLVAWKIITKYRKITSRALAVASIYLTLFVINIILNIASRYGLELEPGMIFIFLGVGAIISIFYTPIYIWRTRNIQAIEPSSLDTEPESDLSDL